MYPKKLLKHMQNTLMKTDYKLLKKQTEKIFKLTNFYMGLL